MKLRHYFPSLAALVVAAAGQAQGPMPVVAGDDKPPVIQLPPFKVVNTAAFDAVKAKNSHPWHVTKVEAPEAWAKNQAAKGKGVKIAVIDTWAQPNHPGLDGKVKGQYDAITKRLNPPTPARPNDHGTHVAGIVHAIAPEADLYLITALSDGGSGSVADIAHGIDYAVSEFKVDLINLSLGGPTADRWQEAAINRAVAAGVVVVAAAGNEGGGPGRDTEGYPARHPNAVSVAASDINNRLASFSSWGPNVFTTKPGVDIRSLLPGNRVGDMDGTSMAAPVESGCVAGWIASNNVPKDASRLAAYRKAVIAASPFKERNNARGHGLYPLNAITGSATTQPPPPPKPDRPFVVTITLADLSAAKQAELKAGGVDTFKLEVGHAIKPATAEPITVPVQSVPSTIPPATEVRNPVPGYWVPPAQPWHQPLPAQVPQYMPGPCPGGVCPTPAPQPSGWVPGQVIRRVFR